MSLIFPLNWITIFNNVPKWLKLVDYVLKVFNVRILLLKLRYASGSHVPYQCTKVSSVILLRARLEQDPLESSSLSESNIKS